ncbi:uncharacterized protein LOC143181744 isoform X2 [Calliopsis andreniformis]|uniref:uncharacterized protein LOC143181744 isoform X2 n=1 Tax=Calliopsis andreniformis TaxID=337506 RepID=UPI003FCD04C0
MEKRSITGKDILRMDGLLPPTRRLPVCDAVTSSDKKKDKKWSLGGILKRISAIRDYDSSSNDEEMVYCTRQPGGRTVFNKKSHVVLRPVEKDSNQHLNRNSLSTDITTNSVDTPSLQRDSAHSRSSDGSLDGLSKKTRKSKLKAQVEAKRDQICGDSSSDEESRKSCNSLARYQTENAMQKNSSCNRKSRAARTERYIKRLSDSHRFPEDLNSISNKRNSLDFMRGNHSMDANELFRPASQSQSNSNTFPVQRSAENLRQIPAQAQSSTDLTKHSTKRYITDLNQNNTYAKPHIPRGKNYKNEEDNYFSNSSLINSDYAKPYDHVRNGQSVHQSSSPPKPPPRDPRCKVYAYNYNSFPFNGKHRATKYDDQARRQVDNIYDASNNRSSSLKSYDSNNEISWCGFSKRYPQRPLSLTTPPQSCSLSECTNNRHNSTGKHVDEPVFHETEAMRCQRRNNRNDQLNSCFNNYDVKIREKKPSSSMQNIYKSSICNRTLDPPWEKSAARQTTQSPKNIRAEKEERETKTPEQEALERRRSSKNLEEALSELEAIYNSLRLGDEDLLDRAERRSMEEFSLRRAKTDEAVPPPVDSPDRSKDDMAYRRMHPKERPTSFSEVTGQSALSNISYLMASPILSRKDATEDYFFTSNYPVRRDEPDVTRDDVVYRSIHHANNTLKVADPQPPFGIPLGPVATATESDYLHTTPNKPEHPRSPYIPQCEPDIVTDDLAYRTLRKDANTGRNSAESKDVATDQETGFGKKKRAVRSLSANLYGLINHDRIHLRREPSLQNIKDEINEAVVDVKSLPVRADCFRRVVSDGELSDYDTRWRGEGSKNGKTDINGNHQVSNVHRKKLRVYISPSTKVQRVEKETQDSTPQNDILSQALSNEFWQDCLQPKPSQSNKDTESDFMAYSRLCQDLVNLIEGQNDAEAKPIEEASDVNLEATVKIDRQEDNNAEDPSVLRIQTLGSQYSRHYKEDERKEDKDARLTEPKEDPQTDDSAFDFYLRVADENVKLIAEAFSSVADRLRDSRLSQKNSLTSRSEIETDSTAPNTSTRSSLAYSQDDLNDDLSSSSKTTDILDPVPKEDAAPAGELEAIELEEVQNTDPELDLSKAVHDLQLAAARLCEHEKEIEELEALLRRDASDAPCATNVPEAVIADESSILKLETEEAEIEKETVISTDVKLRSDEDDPDREGPPALDHS